MEWLPTFGAGYKVDESLGPAPEPTKVLVMTIPIRGSADLIVAAAIVAATAVWLPAYRWFLLISIGIGAAVAGGSYFWHKLRPVRDDDVENKRPLGLS